MEKIRYSINKNDSINRWLITEMKRSKIDSSYKTFEADVNLYEHYVQIVYPVREEFLKNKIIDHIEYYHGDYNDVYFPFESNRVDLTTFINTPHHIWVNTKSYVDVLEGGTYEFELYTCGGVKLWVNREEVITFTPYTRNIPAKCNIKIKLKKGENEIAIYADELAERDVFFYYELRYVGETEILGVLPVTENVEEISIAEKFLESCNVTKDCFYEGEVTINCDTTMLNKDIILTYTTKENIVTQSINKGVNSIEIGDVKTYNLGGINIELSINIGNLTIRRNLSAGIYPREFVEFEIPKCLEERKRKALSFISEHGSSNVNRAIAILEIEKEFTEEAKKSLYKSIEMIRSKADCADFYLPSMFYLWTRYKKYIPKEIMEEIKNITLDFRYWIDEPGNDVMWYFSENHAMLFHVSQYLAGNQFREELFTASGRMGEEQYRVGKERLEEWFDIFFRYGYAEWNSATYIPVDLIGFFVLHDLAPDASIRELAKKAIDFTFEVLVYNTFNGRMTSTFGRAYEDTLKVKELHDTNFILWISYGEGVVNFGTNSIVLYSISDYLPKSLLNDIRLNSNEGLVQELMQGIGQVKTYSFRTNDYFISSARRFRPFEHGHQQHIMNVALGEKNSQFFVNHPGERAFSGGGRPCYWAGNGTMPYVEQYRNLMIMVYSIAQEEVVKYIHAYSPLYQYDEYEISNKWIFIKVEDSYLGVYFNNGVVLTENGANAFKEVISYGEENLVVVKCGSKIEFNSYDNFKNKLKAMEINFQCTENIKLVDPQYGEIILSTSEKIKVNGEEQNYNLTREFNFERVILEEGEAMGGVNYEKINLLSKSFEKVLYEDDVRFLENMKNNNLVGDDISKYRFWEWTQGVGLFGFWRLFEYTKDEKYLEIIIKYYNTRLEEGLPSKNINTVAPMLTLAYLYEYTKNERYGECCREWIDWIVECLPRTKEGGFQHITSDTLNDQELWDDTLFMTVLFLAKMGMILGNKTYIEEAKYQFMVHAKYLEDKKTGLWYHGWTFNGNHNFVEAFWGRGNCWVTIAIPEFIEIIKPEDSTKRFLVEVLKNQVNALVKYQNKNGMWHTLIDDDTSYVEASATCGFGYGILKAVSMNLISEDYSKYAIKALDKIEELVDEQGILNQVSYGTAMGRDSKQFYKDIPIEPMPYGQALALLYFMECLKFKSIYGI